MFCQRCGAKILNNCSFCGSCGTKVGTSTANTANQYNNQNPFDIPESNERTTDYKDQGISYQAKNFFGEVTSRINEMTGDYGKVDLKLKDVFSEVFKRHTKEEGEKIFISGTLYTTPKECEISSSWPKPWLFSRVLLALSVTFFLLYVCANEFNNVNALPGLMVIGSFAIPFSLLVFFWEANAPRNINIYDVVKMFFIGGVASLVITLFIYKIFPVGKLDFFGAIVVGVVEELGKLCAIALFIRASNRKYILNGLLIGAAIGAGFAAFESAGYAFRMLLTYGYQQMLSNIFLRGSLAAGGHVVWAAITGAALVMVKQEATLSINNIVDPRFLKFFLVSVVLHSIWDMPINILPKIYFIPILLTIIAWLFVFVLMNSGLKQISRINISDSTF